MSLINKMLQDLDARGTPAGETLPGQVKPVAHEPRRPDARAIATAVGGLAAGIGLVWFGWVQYHQRHAAVQPKAMQVAPAAQPVAVAAAPVVAPALAPAVAQAAPAAPAASAVPAASRAPAAASAEATPAAAVEPAVSPAQTVTPLEPDGAEARAAREALTRERNARAAAPASSAVEVPARREPRKTAKLRERELARTRASAGAASNAGANTDDAPADGIQPAQGRHADGHQRAENEYRRALGLMQDGRVGDSVAALESTLRIDPSHEAARQTLVGLLVEAGRHDDAMRQAQVGLTLDPRQPALAMLLARLQMEHGGNGIDVLNRTLPYAGNNSDYRAFLAAALERQQRHREAAEQYGAALRGMPSNGVWWMGLGMALQADRRNGEALDAFQKARAAGLPSPELQEFVERHIQQLGR